MSSASKRLSPICIQAPNARTAGSSSTANLIASAAVGRRESGRSRRVAARRADAFGDIDRDLAGTPIRLPRLGSAILLA
jgi:hypothetical protein